MKRIRNNQSLVKLFKYSTTFLIFGLVIIAASQYAPNTKAISTPTSGSCGTWGSFYRQDGGSLSHQTQYVCKSNGTTWRFYRLAPIYAGNSNMLYRKISRGVIGSESNNRTLDIGHSECSGADGAWIFGQEGVYESGGSYHYVNYQNNLWNWQQVPNGWGNRTPEYANRNYSEKYDLINEWQNGHVSLPKAMTDKLVTSVDQFSEKASSDWDNIDGTLATWELAHALYDMAAEQMPTIYSKSTWTTPLEWDNGGSESGLAGFCLDTTILKGTHFDGKTEAYNNTTLIPNGGSVKVRANSTDKIKFKHYLSRRNDGPSGNKNAKYNINARLNDDKVNQTTKSLAKNSGWQLVRDRTIDKADKITLTPGQEKIRWQTLHYTDTDKATTPNTVPNTRCTISGYEANGRYCIKVWRPVANFSGSVAAKIQDGNEVAIDAPNNSHTHATTIRSANGSFTIKFQHTIKRESDDAGGTASTPWSTKITVNSATQDSKNASGNSRALEVGQSQNVKTFDGYTYTGTLRYGETKTICSTLTYAKVVNAKNGNTNDTKSKCVKVYREKAKCAIDQSYRYGVHDGRNIGRIGVVNRTIAGSDSFQFTNYVPSTFTAANGYTNTVNVWARPGDSIRFRYEACAGASYAVYNTSTLNNNTYKTLYTAAGSSSISGRTGYLFGSSVPTTTSTSPLKYSDSRTWNSYSATSGFLFNNGINGNAELTAQSPSNASTNAYNVNSYNRQTYKCVDLPNGPTFTDSNTANNDVHYQIAGRNNTSNCNASSKTTNGGNDVGSTITQSLSWNNLNIVNGVVSGTTRTFKGRARVHVPYNYILRPYAKRDVTTTRNVVYGGSEFTVKTGVYIQPRTNTSITNDTTKNKYATITKPTRVKIERYFTTFDESGNISSTETGLTTISDTNNVLFNTIGDFMGNTSGNGETYPNSTGVSVYVPDDRPVGSLVCLKFSVWPRDSHNNLVLTSGAGNKNVALTSAAEVSGGTAASWATARACYTVAKRPTASFEGSNALSAGPNGFTTSRYTRMASPGSTKYYFGTWSEYALIGQNNIASTHGTASGATFGYKVGATDVAINSTRDNNDPSKTATALNASDSCVLASQMFTNNHACSDTGLLGARITSASNMAKNFATTIKGRYTADTPTKTINVDGLGACNIVTAPGSAKCVKIDNGTKYARINSTNGVIATTAIGDTLHNRINGNAYIDSVLVAPKQTTVYEVNGTLVIGANILTANSGTDPSYTNASGIKQNIIFADNVLIMPNVTKIDALIVSDGLVDTCAYKDISKWKTNTVITMSNLNSETCNHQLVFEAPVITKSINLHRTYGATTGTSSILRAEIFNFNMANYLWDYSQSSKYSEANTTNLRELPPRY